MTGYLHHVPGRLRARSQAFLRNTVQRKNTLRQLQALDGVRSVRLNAKAGSVTIVYEAEATDVQQIFDLLAKVDSCQAEPVYFSKQKRETTSGSDSTSSSLMAAIPSMVGKVALNILVTRGVNYSLSSLLGPRV
ncbi:MAG: heavy-metal-associated domain-containing protein [Chromatiales bacterium]|nr:heavy-metal-associated domain-containing protein [Chromatiales bacterium]